MRQYWERLQARERRLILFGAALLALLLAYALLWLPYHREMLRLEQSVQAQRQTLAWMEQAASEIRRLRGNRPAGAPTTGASLLPLVDRSTKSSKVASAVKRVQPTSDGGVQVWLEGVAFDRLVAWLDSLAAEDGVHAAALTVKRQEAPGLVEARVTLRGTPA